MVPCCQAALTGMAPARRRSADYDPMVITLFPSHVIIESIGRFQQAYFCIDWLQLSPSR